MSNKRKARITYSLDEANIRDNAFKRDDGQVLFNFAKTLNRLLEEKGIDQERMAADLSIAEGSISNYRSGKTEPKLSAIVKIANYLGVDCQYLMTGVQSKHTALHDAGLSSGSIEKITSFIPTDEEREIHLLTAIDSKTGEPVKDTGLPFYSSEQYSLNALIESKSFNLLLGAIEECCHINSFPTEAEQLLDFVDIDLLPPKYKKSILARAETDRDDLAILRVQRAATAIAEELIKKAHKS